MKILVLTTIYPRSDAIKNTAATKVIHYFVKQWQQMGHEVYVAHTPSRYFKLIHWLPQGLKDFIKLKTGNEIMDISITKRCSYDFEGVPVFRRPFLKWKPHGVASDKQINAMAEDIRDYLDKNNFKPDLIVGHWSCPTVQLLQNLCRIYPCKKSVVFHEKYYLPLLQGKLRDALGAVDVLGCRSRSLAEEYYEKLKENDFSE